MATETQPGKGGLKVIHAGLFRTATKSVAEAHQFLGCKVHHALWGRWDVSTDLVSSFAVQLIKANPEAKVVVVQRDFETWWPSFESEIVSPLS
jgi:hypothetical protein